MTCLRVILALFMNYIINHKHFNRCGEQLEEYNWQDNNGNVIEIIK